MIHDKDYIIRIVKQFSELLSKMILGGKNEAEPEDFQRIFDTNMNDTFKMNFEDLSQLSTEEITALIKEKDSARHVPYYELLGHLFYYKFRETGNAELAQKSQVFYENYLQKRGVFSMPIVSRIGELKSAL